MICQRCIARLPKRPSLLNAAPPLRTLQARSISLLAPRRPTLLPSTMNTNAFTQPSLSTDLDLLPKISTSPMLAGIQVRNGPRDTYNMTHFVRKRRHGFLSRIRTRKGRMLLARRRAKGRKNMSH